MKQINNYIIEKLHLGKNSNVEYDVSDIDYNTCTTEIDDDIDDRLNEACRVNKYFPFKKRKNGNKNQNWYKFYCYVYYNGPTRKDDIVKALFPNTNSQYAEPFTELRKYNIISSSKGLRKAEDPRDWQNFPT